MAAAVDHDMVEKMALGLVRNEGKVPRLIPLTRHRHSRANLRTVEDSFRDCDDAVPTARQIIGGYFGCGECLGPDLGR